MTSSRKTKYETCCGRQCKQQTTEIVSRFKLWESLDTDCNITLFNKRKTIWTLHIITENHNEWLSCMQNNPTELHHWKPHMPAWAPGTSLWGTSSSQVFSGSPGTALAEEPSCLGSLRIRIGTTVSHSLPVIASGPCKHHFQLWESLHSEKHESMNDIFQKLPSLSRLYN